MSPDKIVNIKRLQKDALGKLWRIYEYNKADLARALGTTPQTVQGWFKRGRISATMAIIAEQVTEGLITKEELRPDVSEWFGA